MKRMVLIALVLLLALSSMFALDSSIALGYQHKVTDFTLRDPLYVSIDLWQDVGGLRVYGTYTNEMRKATDSWGFEPSQDYFTVGASYDFTAFTITAEHMCSHPISKYAKAGSKVYSSYTRVEVTIGDSL